MPEEDIRSVVRGFLNAVALDPDDHKSGESLCDILDREEKDVLQIAVCQEASSKSRKAFWAYRRLGYLQVDQKKWPEAVRNLQYAIRGYPTCVDLWEALGLAYQRLGMSMAALKAYERALKLDDSHVFALIESGNIYVTISSFQKGIDKFKHALEIFPQNTAACYGLASALYRWSRECICSGALRWASSMLKEASVIAKETAILAGNISCVWKLHGDIQISIAKWFPWTGDGLQVKFSKENFDKSLLLWGKTRSQAAFLASKSYQRALHLTPWRANIYSDLAVVSELISSLSTKCTSNGWEIAEKMALGSLLMEGDNSGFWITLGCVSDDNALKQHAFIRGLQLDPSLAAAWALLGKIYRTHGMGEMAVQAFDLARSIDPSLSLPWASMSEALHSSGHADEAYECILRATQIFPVVEFQLGLAIQSLLSGHISTAQVFTAIHQAAQLSPHSPDMHNLNGLVFESHHDYDSAISSYRLAKYAMSSNCHDFQKSLTRGISVNMARVLCMAGNANDAELEYDILNKEGGLDHHDLKLYAISLWKQGKNKSALSIVKKLAGNIPSMDNIEADRCLVFICRLVYSISGLNVAVKSIIKLPKELLKNPGIKFIICAVDSLDDGNRLDSFVLNDRYILGTHEEIIGMHYLVTLSKLVKHRLGSNQLQYKSGITYLKRVIHMFPGDRPLRNLLGYLVLHCGEWKGPHTAVRCCITDSEAEIMIEKRGLKRATEVIAAASVACYSSGNKNRTSSCSCASFGQSFPSTTLQLQKWLHQEPWSYNSRYLLILNLMQRAREERYPRHLLTCLKRMILVSDHSSCLYNKFQLHLCSSEISFRTGEFTDALIHAASASSLSLPDEGLLLFPHLQMCRAYAALEDFNKLREEYARCLQIRSDHCVGWICLSVLEYRYGLPDDSKEIPESPCLRKCVMGSNVVLRKMWIPLVELFRGIALLQKGNAESARELLTRLSTVPSIADDSVLLCYASMCMELGRKCGNGLEFVRIGKIFMESMEKGYNGVNLPISSWLLALIEGSLSNKQKWQEALKLQWFTWPSEEMRPAELLFQMHLLEEEEKFRKRWVLRSIHLNPSCTRYWITAFSLP